MARLLTLVGIALLCILPVSLGIKFYKYGQCVQSTPCNNFPTKGLKGDWALLVATKPSSDNTFSFWGPTFVGCDVHSVQDSCCNQGIYYNPDEDANKSSGFIYGYNKQLDKWTIENFVTLKTKVPGTDSVAYQTFAYEYITIDTNIIFKDGQCVAYNGTEIIYNPMLRKTRYIVLETDQNESYRIVMNCENMDGFLFSGYPQIQIYVRRSQIEKFNKVSDIEKLVMYDSIKDALTKQNINPAAVQWRYITQDQPCPTETLYNSLSFTDCKCIKTATMVNIETDKGYY